MFGSAPPEVAQPERMFFPFSLYRVTARNSAATSVHDNGSPILIGDRHSSRAYVTLSSIQTNSFIAPRDSRLGGNFWPDLPCRGVSTKTGFWTRRLRGKCVEPESNDDESSSARSLGPGFIGKRDTVAQISMQMRFTLLCTITRRTMRSPTIFQRRNKENFRPNRALNGAQYCLDIGSRPATRFTMM